MSKSYMGKGSIYIEEIGSSTGALELGNCSNLDIAVNESKVEQKDYQGAGGAVTDIVSRIDSVSAAITALTLNEANISLALRGVVNTVAGGAVVDEAHVGNPKAFVKFDKIPDMSIAPVVTGAGGTPVFVDGVDYTLGNAGIVCVAGGGITAGLPILVDYTALASYNIEGLEASGKEYKVTFDGLNEANSGRPVAVTMHRCKFSPTQALSLISDEFATLPLTLDLLKDPSVIGAGESQFLKVEMTQV